MPFPTFQALTERLVQLFQERHYAAALDLATREGARFRASRAAAEYWRMCAAARLDDRPLFVQIAGQALAEGLWYGERLWRQTPSFQPLQGDPEFERLVTASRAVQQSASTGAPGLVTRLPANHSPASPLLVALHGNQASAETTLPFWQAALAQGWALALPQSSEALYTGAFVWDDLAAAEAQVQAEFARLPEHLAYDPRRVVLGGHSIGGLLAVQLALRGAVAVRGFVANGPAVPFEQVPDDWQAWLAPARDRGLRGCVILGADDPVINHGGSRALVAALQAAGVACALDIVPGATHDYSPAYDEALLRGLAFMEGP